MMFFHGFGGGVDMEGGRGGAAADDDDRNHQQRRMGTFLFPKPQLQQHRDHHVQAPPPQQQQQQQKQECYSDEVNSRSDDAGAGDSEQRRRKRQRKSSAQPAPSVKTTGAAGDEVEGSTVGVAKRPRGRPPGSKNKPKPPVVNIRVDAEDAPSPAAMRPHVFEVTDGRDVVDALSRFSRRRNLGLCILAGTGLVANVVLRQLLASPSPAPGSVDISYPGHFEILSISATFLPPSFTTSPPTVLPEGSGAISLSLAGPHGRVFGGLVAGPLTAVGTVTIFAAAFCKPTYYRLPAEDDVSVSVSGDGGDVEAATRAHASQAPRHHQRPQHNATSHHHHQHHHGQQEQRSTSPPSSSSAAAQNNHCRHHPAAALGAPTAVEARGMSMYSCHLPSDVIWAPAARSPPF